MGWPSVAEVPFDKRAAAANGVKFGFGELASSPGVVSLAHDLLLKPANGPSVAVRPHWRNALAATVNRFTGGTQIRQFLPSV